MATDQSVADNRKERVELGPQVRNGSLLMALAGAAFIGYGIVFLALNFVGSGFELGVSTLDGMTKAELNPTVAYYISHLHVATAAFIISTGIAVASLSWYGVRQRLTWAWATAVVSAVVGLALALPMHWTGDAFAHDWLTHLGPIYLATLVFVVGAALSYRGLQASRAF
jgi:cytochrome bd-type quinol oxidase subunit 1